MAVCGRAEDRVSESLSERAYRAIRDLIVRVDLAPGDVIREDDLPWVRVSAAEPIACQVDGDFLGMRDEMVFTAVPAALAVVAPPRNNLVELRK